jgi:hypothetical protein
MRRFCFDLFDCPFEKAAAATSCWDLWLFRGSFLLYITVSDILLVLVLIDLPKDF